MSISLTQGLVVVVRGIGHYCHRTPLSLILHSWNCLKHVAYERKVNKREEVRNRIFAAERHVNDPEVMRKAQIVLNFRYSLLRNRWDSDLPSHGISDGWPQEYDLEVDKVTGHCISGNYVFKHENPYPNTDIGEDGVMAVSGQGRSGTFLISKSRYLLPADAAQ
jgi:hypothetical protein